MARCFKTRSEAAAACSGNLVRLNEHPAKPAATVRPGDMVQHPRGFLKRHVRVLAIPLKRVGPPDVPTFLEDITPLEAVEIAEERAAEARLAARRRFSRPTKRDRRQIRAILEAETAPPDPADNSEP